MFRHPIVELGCVHILATRDNDFFQPVKLAVSIHIQATATSDKQHRNLRRDSGSLIKKIAVA